MSYTDRYEAQEPMRSQVDAWPGAAVLEFGAPWCGYCIGAQSAIRAVLGSHDGVRHVKVEDGSGRPLGRSFRVKLWPTLVFLRDGEERARLVRPAHADEIARALAMIDRA